MATHASALTMGAGHRRVNMPGEFTRAIIYSSNPAMDAEGQVLMQFSYYFELICARPLNIHSMCFGVAFQSSVVWENFKLRRLVQDLFWLLFRLVNSGLVRLSLAPCSNHLVSMVRERGRPRRGSAWIAHREQRRRKQEMERAMSLASSIMRRRARAERRLLLDSMVEQKAGCSRDGMKPGESNERDVEPSVELSICIIEEELPCSEMPQVDPPCTVRPQALEVPVRTSHSADYTPGCPIEEIPWQEEPPSFQAEQPMDNKASEEQRKDADEPEKERNVGAAEDGIGGEGGLHGFLLNDEHLSLIFELRSHLDDLELRTLLMSQRLDILLSVFSGAPAQHKCPMCAQEFAFPAGHYWQARDDDGALDV